MQYVSRALPLFHSVTPNIRSIVYKYGMMSGGTPEDWDKMWNKYKVETVPQEQIKLLYGMANTRTMWLLVRFVNFSHVYLLTFWSNAQLNVSQYMYVMLKIFLGGSNYMIYFRHVVILIFTANQ